MHKLQRAGMQDTEECCAILEDGKKYQRAQGFVHWPDDYPQKRDVVDDISHHAGYIYVIDGQIAACLSLHLDGEPFYSDPRAKWRTDSPCAVLQNLAVAAPFRSRHLAGEILDAVGLLCCVLGISYIRTDITMPNRRMQHIAEKHGFVRCGLVSWNGGDHFSYDRILTRSLQKLADEEMARAASALKAQPAAVMPQDSVPSHTGAADPAMATMVMPERLARATAPAGSSMVTTGTVHVSASSNP